MANIIPVPRKLSPKDFVPNYDLQLQGIAINEEEAENQKKYLQMFITENFEILESQVSGMTIEGVNSYIRGAKDMLAFVNLWIDSLNALE